MNFFDGTGGCLNQAIAGLAIFHSLDIVIVERKTLQVRKLWRSAEHAESQIAGKLAQPVRILGKPKVSLWRSVNVDRAEEEDLSRSAGWQCLRHRLSISDGRDLVLIQSDVVLEKRSQVWI